MFSLLIILLLVVVLAIGVTILIRLRDEEIHRTNTNNKLDRIMKTQDELIAELRTALGNIKEGQGEVIGKIAELEKKIEEGAPKEELVALVGEISTGAQAIADIIPGKPAEPPAEG